MVYRVELNPDASPEAAYGARLRQFREARGWTQEQLADQGAYTGKHISAVETARKSPTLGFSRDVDAALGTADTADSFEREWREIRQGSLIEGFPEYVTHEARAAEIRLYEVGVIPGLLQTPEYAAAIQGGEVKRGACTPEQAEERVALVAQRQEVLVRHRPPLVFVVLDESCIRRPVGTAAVWDAQLARLTAFAELPNSAVHVAPFTMGERRACTLPVTVLTLPDRTLMSYAESSQRGHLEKESRYALPMLTAYHQLQTESLSQAASLDMIDQVRKGTP
ncbi:helix-turn-helix transcriptional regulator [Streptomyces sp. NBC_00102]|uniref:helix-turn-helix domain-containing protein n=1 Tax=Streptomyces sp. NBC_00102 TaxID=2975652 RepID=UPI0022513A5F|nr:helix-turn-helix transcriptional regulator [Streptomyces sp. NBC_00102]MCX5398488.1 helix-turn-helix transcriptional regulator [Streptomyces sp. NBC_00102]